MGILVVVAGRHIGTEDTIRVGDIAIEQLGLLEPRITRGQRVISLFVLPPPDAADKALIVEQYALPTDPRLPVLVRRVLQEQLIQIRAIRIRNDWILTAVRAAGAGTAVEVVY